ncbi:hypothetical protein ANN_15040 [Periplaneta americana]|uniref:Uncharacterized protein n=1 Tax=Periplaneta americana TaxID=6978 RepID=A0ABQ8SZA8_PERAM|nr:hypothetical protein ANN_15040 [Periplaneta americana]
MAGLCEGGNEPEGSLKAIFTRKRVLAREFGAEEKLNMWAPRLLATCLTPEREGRRWRNWLQDRKKKLRKV